MHILTESLLIEPRLVGRNRNDAGLGIEMRYAVSGPGYARGSVAMNGFHQQIVGRQLRQLAAHKVGILHIGIDENMTRWNNFRHPVVGVLQLRAPGSEKINKLLGILFTAAWP